MNSDAYQTLPSLGELVLHRAVMGRLFASDTSVSLGRFRVLEQIGAGGMGRVFRAHDCQLDREVAIKVLHRASGEDIDRVRERLVLEARALARLAHPNVVVVHEVGEFEGHVFLVMECVHGTTLRQFMADGSDPSTVLALFVQAGMGLAAAHRRGLIHRDFKPDNVLIDAEDRRARVADFGLVWATLGSAEQPTSTQGTAPRAVGTPQYMSPEQLGGEPVDARSDQYSFCVALSEAIAMFEGRAGTRRLRALRRVTARGLQADPSRRFADMGQLLDALRAAGRPSSRWVAPVVLAVAIGAGGVVWHERRDPCNAAGERIESAFAPSLAEPLHAAAGASGLPFAADAVATVHALAEQSVHSLAQTSAAACRLALPPEHADRTKHCLTWSEQRLQHEVNRLQNGDHGGEEHRERWIAAVDRLAELSSPTLCLDVERLASWSSEPPDDPDAFFRLADKLAELDPRGTGETLDHAAALGRVMAIEREAEDSGHPLVRVWAAMRQAELRTRLGENREAEDTLRRVIGEAEALGDTHLRVHAQALLVYVVGLDPERRGVAEVLAEQALAGLGDGLRDELYRARILSHRGIMYARARDRDYARAEQDHAVAVSLLVRHLGEQHPQSIAARVNWATALTRSGEAAQALPVAREAWQDARALWGDDHPQTGKVAAALALTSMRVGDLPEAEFLLRSALAIFEKAAQANDVEITNTLYDLHLVLVRADRPVEATKALTDGLARFEQRVGAEHPSLIPWLFALGHLELGAQRHPQAEASFDRALALCENDGAPAYDFSRIRLGLARSVAATEPGKARVLAEQACTFFAESPEHRTSEADCRRFLTDLAGP